MKSGEIVERRDQVLTGFLSLFACAASTFFTRWASMNGPFSMNVSYLILISCRGARRSWKSYACYGASSCPSSVGPKATLDDDQLRFYLHHHRAGDRPGS